MNVFTSINKKTLLTLAGLLAAVSGCTVHPVGEKDERQSATVQGRPFLRQAADRQLPVLSQVSTSEELVRYALLASPELEQKYWEWRSAIEQIPQDGTQPTNLVLSAGVPITRGSTAFNRTTVTVANDPMADIVWPSKLGTAATRALQTAKAAGFRFQKAKYELRRKVLDAYLDHALAVELLKLDRVDLQLLTTSATVTEAGIAAGNSTQSDAIKAHNEVDLLTNNIEEQEARLPALVAALNDVMGRDPAAPLVSSTTLPSTQTVIYTQKQLLAYTAERNSELAALDAETAGREQSVRLAKLQYLPDFSLSIGSDLAGNVQNLLGTLTVPLLRYEAINAAVAQAEANLRATDSMKRQTQNDLRASVVSDTEFLKGADKQLTLLNNVILPRARQNSDIARSSYERGRAPLSDLFNSQQSAVAIERLIVQLKVAREKQNADLESIIADRTTSG